MDTRREEESNAHQVTSRGKQIARIQRLLERLLSPRLQMMLIVALTGTAGFLASFALLRSGVDSLWLRYPVAVAIAYAAFLFFLLCWLRLRRDDLLDDLDSLDSLTPDSPSGASSSSDCHAFEEPWQAGGGQFGGGGASGSFEETPHATQIFSEVSSRSSDEGSNISHAAETLDLEELAIVLLAIAALAGAAWAALWIVWAAPALLAELLLDAALAAGLYRRLRGVSGNYWLRTAIRRTGWQFAVVAILFALAGGLMQIYAPEAKSIGQVIRHYNEVR
ncbi:MAG: hypothetical protein V4568_13710 [Pseudomonadota bacterium]